MYIKSGFDGPISSTFNLQSMWEVLEDVQDSAFEDETANLVEYGNECFDQR